METQTQTAQKPASSAEYAHDELVAALIEVRNAAAWLDASETNQPTAMDQLTFIAGIARAALAKVTP
jgi:hypothetical protein